jgi:hypothetical protein
MISNGFPQIFSSSIKGAILVVCKLNFCGSGAGILSRSEEDFEKKAEHTRRSVSIFFRNLTKLQAKSPRISGKNLIYRPLVLYFLSTIGSVCFVTPVSASPVVIQERSCVELLLKRQDEGGGGGETGGGGGDFGGGDDTGGGGGSGGGGDTGGGGGGGGGGGDMGGGGNSGGGGGNSGGSGDSGSGGSDSGGNGDFGGGGNTGGSGDFGSGSGGNMGNGGTSPPGSEEDSGNDNHDGGSDDTSEPNGSSDGYIPPSPPIEWVDPYPGSTIVYIPTYNPYLYYPYPYYYRPYYGWMPIYFPRYDYFRGYGTLNACADDLGHLASNVSGLCAGTDQCQSLVINNTQVLDASGPALALVGAMSSLNLSHDANAEVVNFIQSQFSNSSSEFMKALRTMVSSNVGASYQKGACLTKNSVCGKNQRTFKSDANRSSPFCGQIALLALTIHQFYEHGHELLEGVKTIGEGAIACVKSAGKMTCRILGAKPATEQK